MSAYVQMTTNGSIHIRRDGTTKTNCGRDYYNYDFLSYTEEELGDRPVCYKCRNKQRTLPRTIKEAFVKNRLE